jgi:NADH:ubiquinone oxidoreductase subunit 4 (subunit M)
VDYYLRDHAGNVRIAVVEDEQMRRVLYRDPKTREWTMLGAMMASLLWIGMYPQPVLSTLQSSLQQIVRR